MIVRRAYKSHAVVAGGGAIEMELSRFLREYLRDITGKQQLVINGFAKALETIPRTLAENSGMDSTDVLNKLRQKHAQAGPEGIWFGVNVLENNVDDMMKKFVWEPEQVRINVILASTEAACSILGVDQTIRNPKSEQQAAQAAGRLDGSNPAGGMGRGGGRGGRGRGGRGQIPGFKTMSGRGGK
jgi:T-complex protein 1 subunit eta